VRVKTLLFAKGDSSHAATSGFHNATRVYDVRSEFYALYKKGDVRIHMSRGKACFEQDARERISKGAVPNWVSQAIDLSGTIRLPLPAPSHRSSSCLTLKNPASFEAGSSHHENRLYIPL
jgi:hypothetical protein